MSQVFSEAQQFADWLALNNAIDEIAGGQTPCRNAPDVWFPRTMGTGIDQVVNSELRDARQAKELCLTNCEVVTQCRAYALKHEEIEGVWGGMTARDRRDYWKAKGHVIKKAS